ncbi:MAG: ATP-dependent DNA helicase UvrD2 [Sphingobacteriales bacterium]|uniref:helix-turn-helix domain-containing protein n=1 Tax=Hydrotalea flava TaxID=714549 RepID=UPI0008339DCC|nr:helix-turn-helix domain-containing protein [Hydrotalea flava]RTL49276.1 MAG: ATP-dependent DNA helicase UvrD2 [Sphingobacteriales bacterium]
MVTDTSNKTFQLAADFIQYTQRSVFLTGKAGTGKTTFLKYIKEQSFKQLAIVAPTGVAAINAGGVTIHSFFQLPFSPFIPETNTKNYFQSNVKNASPEMMDRHYLLGRIKINTERRRIFNELELLIIDEISMVRADVLDAIDTVLRHFRKRHYEPFGGVQVLLIGDMYQLPPVARQEEWQILSKYYESPYFFSSRVIQSAPPAYIELDKIYRQKDADFIEVLNQIRNNCLNNNGYALLHQNYRPDFQGADTDGYIMLTTHNEKADHINAQQLKKLTSPTHTFHASIEQDFPEKNYPADVALQLRTGAQVMFIKNDADKAKRYFNGKIGIIEKITDDKIYVRCTDDPDLIEVKKYRWEHVRYAHNAQKQQIEEEVVGSFTQYPLRLAWAITIHKSQGLTFEKAIIDAGAAFAPGQVYVALSRCTGLQGVLLHSKISAQSLHTDQRIVNFAAGCKTEALPYTLQQSKKLFQQKTIIALFNFETVTNLGAALKTLITEQQTAFNDTATDFVQKISEKIDALIEVGKKFHPQLIQLFQEDELPEAISALQLRIQQAALYFDKEIQTLLEFLKTSPVSTDSKLQALHYNDLIKELYTQLAKQQYQLQLCNNGFYVDVFLQKKKAFTMPFFSVNAYATAIQTTNKPVPNAALFKLLKAQRDSLCESKNLPIYMVAGSNSLYEMAQYLPQTLNDLKKISGFGTVKTAQYGMIFLDIIQRYCNEHDLPSLMDQIKVKKERKEKSDKVVTPDTKLISFQLYQSGKSIAAIAEERQLTVQTIQNHLSRYVAEGKLKVTDFLPEKKLNSILPLLTNDTMAKGITLIKQNVVADISYADIRMAIAWKTFLEKQNTTITK